MKFVRYDTKENALRNNSTNQRADTESNLVPLFQQCTTIKGVAHKAKGLCERLRYIGHPKQVDWTYFLTMATSTKFEPAWISQTFSETNLFCRDNDFHKLHHLNGEISPLHVAAIRHPLILDI